MTEKISSKSSPDSPSQKQEKSIEEMGFEPRKFDHEWEMEENLDGDVDSESPKKYILDVLKMLQTREFCDTLVCIGDNRFPCHMVVLKNYSLYFKYLDECSQGYQEKIELPEKEVSAVAFQTIYEWMLQDDATVSRKNFVEVLKAVSFLKVHQMKEQFWSCIDNLNLFNERSAFTLYLEAKKIDFPLIKTIMLSRISKVFLTVVASKEFLELTFNELKDLLKSNNIAVNSELDVLHSVIRWLQFNWDARRNHTLDLLKCVRFSRIQSWQIVEMKSKNCPTAIQHIFKQPEITTYLDEALTFISMKFYEEESNQNVEKPDNYNWETMPGELSFKFLNIKEQTARKLVRDPLWDNFKFEKNANIYENYCNFKKYLHLIRKCGNNHWKLLE